MSFELLSFHVLLLGQLLSCCVFVLLSFAF